MAPVTTINELCVLMKQAILAHFEGLPKMMNFVIILPINHITKVTEVYTKEELQIQISKYWKVEPAPHIVSLNFGWMADGAIAVDVAMKHVGPITTWTFSQHNVLVQKMINIYASHMDKDFKICLSRNSLAKDFNPCELFNPGAFKFPAHIDTSTLCITLDHNYLQISVKA